MASTHDNVTIATRVCMPSQVLRDWSLSLRFDFMGLLTISFASLHVDGINVNARYLCV